jgi:hypothetical protein
LVDAGRVIVLNGSLQVVVSLALGLVQRFFRLRRCRVYAERLRLLRAGKALTSCCARSAGLGGCGGVWLSAGTAMAVAKVSVNKVFILSPFDIVALYLISACS